MTASPSSAAQAAREAVAARLADIRRTSGLTGTEIAARCGWHKSKASRIENARTPPSDADIRAWCTACGALDQVADLIAASRNADQLYVEWRRIHRDGIRQRQEADRSLYEQTRVIRVYCSNVVPGLLQTHGYAESLFATISQFQGTPNDAAQAAQARLERSQVIRRGDHRFVLLMEETVLRYRIGNPDVMAGQLGYLLDIASAPSVALGIIPFNARRGMRMWPVETFMIFDNDRAQVETLTAEINITTPSEIASYAEAFSRLRRMAVYGAKARARITEAISALE